MSRRIETGKPHAKFRTRPTCNARRPAVSTSMIRARIILVFLGSIFVLASMGGSTDGTNERIADSRMPDGGALCRAVSDGGVELVSFGEAIQPIFNKRCTSWHNAT